MLNIFIISSLLLGFVYSELGPILVPGYDLGCPQDFIDKCNIQCPNANYVIDDKGCPTCKCASKCPEIKCRANCGDAGYVIDENGCDTCKCAKQKPKVECSKVMCRMFCENGFQRDENGCEFCACNQSPQPCPELNCEQACSNGYRKDYSGCQTCECIDAPKSQPSSGKCVETICDLNCKYGFQRDESGCQQCACNTCPIGQCRKYCTYGFLTNEDGCEVCECDWSPVAEKIQCDERIPCTGARVCNLNLRLCEIVSPDRVNWFLYDFQVENGLFDDEKFVQTFKNGLIHNIATKYGLSKSQITVSSVEGKGLTSFQIMPFFNEDIDTFEKKMDQIDIDLNSHEFREVLPAVADLIEGNNDKPPTNMSKWCGKFRSFIRSKSVFFITILLVTLTGFIILTLYIINFRRIGRFGTRTNSKLPIYDASYAIAPNDDDHYHSVHAPDGTRYVVVESDDMNSSNDRRALV